MKTTKTKTKTKPKGIGNPALTTAVASLATTKAGDDAIKSTGKVVRWVLIGGVLVAVAAVGYKIYQARFVKMLQNINYPKPTISASVARIKADNLYNAMHGFGANLSTVKAQLLGLNYNDFVMVYNAFGRRETALQGVNPINLLNVFRIGIKGMTLTEWLLDQFKGTNNLADLRTILPKGVI